MVFRYDFVVGRDNSVGKKGYRVLQYGNGLNELGKHYWDDTKRQAGYRMTDAKSEACTKNQLYFYTSLVSDFSECIRLIDYPTPAPVPPGTCRACLPKGATCESWFEEEGGGGMLHLVQKVLRFTARNEDVGTSPTGWKSSSWLLGAGCGEGQSGSL
ncbi:hypothetical protein IG631_02444 [Alternaria alternata]|nr:hypothetical protein IG631_02444 [Alternaria alternata]